MNFNDTILKDAKYCVGIAIMNSNSTKNLKYKKTYKYKDFTVISNDTLNIFKPLLLQIARTNVTANPRGDSQIGEAKPLPLNTPGHDEVPGGTEYTYLQIKNDVVAKQFFEFAGENTKVEFARDRFSFSDGFRQI